MLGVEQGGKGEPCLEGNFGEEALTGLKISAGFERPKSTVLSMNRGRQNRRVCSTNKHGVAWSRFTEQENHHRPCLQSLNFADFSAKLNDCKSTTGPVVLVLHVL